ncbi:MAG TPA: zf-HC2 domain-containing protein, partial [Ktedonobacterales bacterium]
MSDELTPGAPPTGATLTCAVGVTPERLSAWRDGLLPADQAEWLATHVAGCPACGARLRDYEQIDAALREQTIPRAAANPWSAMRQRLTTYERRKRRGLPRRAAWGGLGALVAAALLVALFAGLLGRQ